MRRPRIIIFDMDGVITKIKNSWRYLHEYFTPGADLSFTEVYKEKYLRGEISYVKWMSIDIETLLRNVGRDISKREIVEAFSKVGLYDEINHIIRRSMERSVRAFAIVSGGISILARLVGDRLGIKEIYSNHLVFNEQGFLVPGGIPLVEPLGKNMVIKKILSKLGIDENEAIYIGDSIWDLTAFEVVAYPIAINCSECLSDRYKDKIINTRDHEELVKILFKNILV